MQILTSLLTLIVLASFRLGMSNLAIVGNAQNRNESIASAQQAIEEAITSPLLTTAPQSIFPAPCAGANTQCYDVNGDGRDDVTVTLTPDAARSDWVFMDTVREKTLATAPGQAATVTRGANAMVLV